LLSFCEEDSHFCFSSLLHTAQELKQELGRAVGLENLSNIELFKTKFVNARDLAEKSQEGSSKSSVFKKDQQDSAAAASSRAIDVEGPEPLRDD
jgi:hypothetical protein